MFAPTRMFTPLHTYLIWHAIDLTLPTLDHLLLTFTQIKCDNLNRMSDLKDLTGFLFICCSADMYSGFSDYTRQAG